MKVAFIRDVFKESKQSKSHMEHVRMCQNMLIGKHSTINYFGIGSFIIFFYFLLFYIQFFFCNIVSLICFRPPITFIKRNLVYSSRYDLVVISWSTCCPYSTPHTKQCTSAAVQCSSAAVHQCTSAVHQCSSVESGPD